jgi:uncharacterized membrane protein
MVNNMKTREFLDQVQADAIAEAIRRAEAQTSGEIRVFVSQKKPEDAMAEARRQFARLKMHQTRERNGVLIFVAPLVQQFAIVGDEGIHAKCGDCFWDGLAQEMSSRFQEGQYTKALAHCVEQAGELLSRHFPRRPDDVNELPNAVATD